MSFEIKVEFFNHEGRKSINEKGPDGSHSWKFPVVVYDELPCRREHHFSHITMNSVNVKTTKCRNRFVGLHNVKGRQVQRNR